MKHPLVLGSFAVSLLAALLTGCVDAPSQSDGGVSVVLRADRSTVTANTPVTLTITITNRGTSPTEIVDPRSYGCAAPFGVVSASGHPVLLPARVCSVIAFDPLVLLPGDSAIVTDQWSGDQSDGDLGAVPVAPGDYQIATRLAPRPHHLMSSFVTVSVASK